MHTLFTLEDLRGLRVGEIDGEICLRLDKTRGRAYDELLQMLFAWHQQATKLETGEITREQYDQWRYRYPQLDTTQCRAAVPSQMLSDLLVEELKK